MDRVNMQDFSEKSPRPAPVPPLVMSSSNVSTSTLDSELTSPNATQETLFHAVNDQPVKSALRDSTSPSGTATSDDSLFARDAAALHVGSKRTASGTVKPASPTRVARPAQKQEVPVKRHSAIELSADLRTRLKYAMLKVQNGWESQNIEQLEQLPVNSPKRATTDSPNADWSRRGSVSSSDVYLMSPMSTSRAPHDTSRVLQRQLQYPSVPPHLAHHVPNGLSTLAPPAQITSQRRPRPRSFSSRFGGPIGRNRSGSTISQGITNQAEQDAVNSLLFMSSPVNQAGGRAGVNRFAGSPSRNKRVEFDISGGQGR